MEKLILQILLFKADMCKQYIYTRQTRPYYYYIQSFWKKVSLSIELLVGILL